MNIGGLNIAALPTWTFHPFGQIILARPDSGVGSLQISLAFRHDLRGKASAEACSSVAHQFVSRDGMSEAFDTVEIRDGESLFGGFSYTVGDDFGRVWYHFVQQQLLLGMYSCPKQRTSEAPGEVQQSEQIIRSAQYAT
jgi:hypothetical protein